MDATTKSTKRPDLKTEVLDACEELTRQGKPITYAALVEMTGRTATSIETRIWRLRNVGEFPYTLTKHSNLVRHRFQMIADAAQELEAEGARITYKALAQKIGSTPGYASVAVQWARDHGLWRWTICRPDRDIWEKERRIKASMAAKAAGQSQRADPAILAQVQASWTKDMINGRDEQDDTPPGVPPKSNKDHAVWGRMRFERANADIRERRRHGGRYQPREQRGEY